MKNRERRLYILTICLTVIAMAVMLGFTFISFYSNAVSSMEAVGQNSLAQETEKLNGYLLKGMDVLQVTAISVEYMMQEGATSAEIERFLLEESERYQEEIDENFTGIYGLFQGVYLDGIGWVPDEGYEPRTREWYVAAVEGGGKPVIVSPYLDAQTHTIMISVSQMLYDGDSVISLDIAMDELQIITRSIQLDGKGYGFVVDREGLVVAHYDDAEKGKNYKEDTDTDELLDKIYQVESGSFQTRIAGEDCTVFTSKVMDDWHVAMVVSNTRLFSEIRGILFQNIILCSVVLLLIVAFCTLIYRRVRHSVELERESNEKIRKLNDSIVSAFARTIDAKDRYTKGHSQRVAAYALEIAKRMGKSQEELADIYCAGLLHDLGKIRVPEDVINKPGKLTSEEFEQIKIHPVTGYHILKSIYGDSLVAQGTKFHHERYDGRGYPSGLQGEAIPEIARILGVADAYDAMTSNRSYRKALPQDVVRAEIEKARGTQFDPEIADIMLGIIDEDKDYRMRQIDVLQKTILVVDDEPLNVEMIGFIMEDEPMYRIVAAYNCDEALKIFTENSVDMVLLDIEMPGKDGFDTLEKIREISSVPVVFMTAYKDAETIRRATALGVDDYITKPYMPMTIREVIHSLLQ